MERIPLLDRLPTDEYSNVRFLMDRIADGQHVYVTAMPMIRFGRDEADNQYYRECDKIVDTPVRVLNVNSCTIDPLLNRHIGEEYQGDYYTASVLDEETGVEYLIGIRDELGFSVRV